MLTANGIEQRMNQVIQRLVQGINGGHRALLAAALLVACLPWVGTWAQNTPAIRTYQAAYGVEYKGHHVGHAWFEVAYDAATDRFRFNSRTTAAGLARLLIPRPILESSEFTVADGRITPLRFSFEDGSRRGEDNFSLIFDWPGKLVRAEQGGEMTEIAIPEGTLDRATLQVALMRDMLVGLESRSYRLVDEDSVREYTVLADGSETLTTEAGTFDTRRFVQSRPDSSRRTILWAAPALDFLPVRIEQQRAGETRMALLLEQVHQAPAAPPIGCSAAAMPKHAAALPPADPDTCHGDPDN
jgi:hypothetical protein